ISIAIGAWYGLDRTIAMWAGIAGVICFVVLAGLQLQQYVWRSQDKSDESDRPYISIAALGFPGVLIQPGPVIIVWTIKCTKSQATITEANMTLWFEEKTRP